MSKVIFIQTAFIGDAILASAAIEKWHMSKPQDQISLLVRKGNEGLFTGHPFLHEVLVWDKKQGKYSSMLATLKQVKKNKFDLVVNFHRFASSGIFTIFSGAKATRGFKKNPLSRWFQSSFDHPIGKKGDKHFKHEIERNQQLIAKETGEEAAQPRLYPSPAEIQQVEPLMHEPFITISPASVWATKAWPSARWIGLIDQLQDTKVYLLGGPGDAVDLEKIQTQTKHQNVSVLAGKLSLLASAQLMSHAKMNFVNDSAPLHLASAMNAPVAALFCSTIPEFGFGPTRDHALVIESRQELACRPCGLHGKKVCPLSHFNCAQFIEDQQLINAANQEI